MIKVLNYTNNPLTSMGLVAGICYNTKNPDRFPFIAKRCLKEGHDRVSEFADMTIQISGYSAKMVRELFTSIVGTSRLQASTRYIDYSKQFNYITPPSILHNEKAIKVWSEVMESINSGMKELKKLDIPVEDLTNLLPLAYDTTMVLKINVRALIHMFNIRACTCAYHEFRLFMTNLKKELYELDDEWKFLCDNYFVPKCIANGYCNETTRTCGLRPVK